MHEVAMFDGAFTDGPAAFDEALLVAALLC
jgi:hypothetical protein